MSSPAGGARRTTRLLDAIERIGNRLPAPATLFLIGAVLVMVLSQVAASLDWTVEKTISREVTQPLLDAGRSTSPPTGNMLIQQPGREAQIGYE